jgi:hypothetical protein
METSNLTYDKKWGIMKTSDLIELSVTSHDYYPE